MLAGVGPELGPARPWSALMVPLEQEGPTGGLLVLALRRTQGKPTTRVVTLLDGRSYSRHIEHAGRYQAQVGHDKTQFDVHEILHIIYS